MEYRALSTEYGALLMKCRALSIENRGGVTGYRALLMKYRALFMYFMSMECIPSNTGLKYRECIPYSFDGMHSCIPSKEYFMNRALYKDIGLFS